ncbi:TrpA Tryptophan synthase alpha chain [Caulobacteraceae bacterium]
MPVGRLSNAFARAKAENRAALVAYVMAGDPSLEVCAAILDALPKAGVDVIELGFPFTDPMADGPSIQRAGIRALKNGTTLRKTMALVAQFRQKHPETPLIVMGYLNPVETMGYGAFARHAAEVGIDGAIIVDAPPEEDSDLRAAMQASDLALIRLATPTTDAKRLPAVVAGVSGFVYYVSVAGITGDKAIETADIAEAVAAVRQASGLPVAVGFGIKTPEAAARTAKIADGVVVGSALVDVIASAHETGSDAAQAAAAFCQSLSQAIAQAR